MNDDIFIGIDIEEISRCEKIAESRVFSESEKKLFEGKGQNRLQTVAANFCAKEAVLKALGKERENCSLPSLDLLTSIEVLREVSGRPYINLCNELKEYKDKYSFDISLTHTKTTAAAVVLARKKKNTLKDERIYPLTLIRPRQQNSHKGTFGSVELFCGSRKMTGAAVLCAKAALRSGVGLVYMPLPYAVRKIIQHHLCEPVFNKAKNPTAIVVGCGLTVRRAKILKKLKKMNLPIVVDADAVTYLSRHMNILEQGGNEKLVLTPHPLEFARLLSGGTKGDISTFVPKTEEDRKSTARDFAVKYGLTLVLKGHRTIVATKDGETYVNSTGNSGLAKGGSGDVLAGLLGGLLAQGYSAHDAAILAVWLHGKASENIGLSQSAVLPSDICVEIGNMINDEWSRS
ncbi:MAG: NAD(P)H-hydrate dehydratase [Clostridiales bacterium]|nr:MAG: NAD(P)H-hydrate dehydratase [Clostridiales bacterium]